MRRKPYAVVLFDEIEKADPDVWNLLLQILDAGVLKDATGQEVSFKNTVIIVTSNIGAQYLVAPSKGIGFNQEANQELPSEKVLAELKKTFKPELLNRFDELIVFDRLTKENLLDIAKRMTGEITERARKVGINLSFTDSAMTALADLGFDPVNGARPLRRTIQKQVEDKLALLMLSSSAPEADDIVVCGCEDGEIVLTIRTATPA